MVGATLGVAVLGAIFAAHAGAGSPGGSATGWRAAFLIGGASESLGALLALCFVRRDSLHRAFSG
jgi:MFS transporter, DHA2 family, methylenomycin A resistance protein